MPLFQRRASGGGDSTMEMMPGVHHHSNHEDTHKEVYAAPHNHYLGSPNNPPGPHVPENFPELAPQAGLEPVKLDDPYKYGGAGGGAFFNNQDYSPVPLTSTTASDPNKYLPPTPSVSNKKPWYQNWTVRILIIALTVIIIVAIIVGAVVGTQAGKDSPDNSEDEDASETATSTTSAPTSTATTEPDEDGLRIGVSYNATFTMYGTDDGSNGTNCNVRATSCGFYSDPGFAVGVSTNLFTVAGGTGGPSSPICGTCWLLETFEDDSGGTFKRNITAIVNEECSGEPDEICGMETLEDTNYLDANVNFNLCTDSGARDALFEEGSELGLAVGRVTRVSCDDWEGEIIG